MHERRKEKRVSIYSHVDVIDREYDEKIGILIDISPKGLRVKGPEPIEVSDHVKIRLRLPERIFGKKAIDLVAECMWSNPDTDPQYWQSGFEFYDVSQEDSGAIIGLIIETEKSV